MFGQHKAFFLQGGEDDGFLAHCLPFVRADILHTPLSNQMYGQWIVRVQGNLLTTIKWVLHGKPKTH